MIGTLLLFLMWGHAQNPPAHCLPPAADEISISKMNFTTLIRDEAEAKTSFEATYNDPRRLAERVYWSEALSSFVVLHDGREYKIAAVFIQNLQRHIEKALARGYGEYVFYPDVGHAHLEIPDGEDPYVTDHDGALEKLLANPNLKFLFHTAELFVLKQDFTGPLLGDSWWQWRYFSRNFVGENNASEDLAVLFASDAFYNTVRTLPNHTEHARVYLSANKNGCFTFRQNGQIKGFDVSFEGF